MNAPKSAQLFVPAKAIPGRVFIREYVDPDLTTVGREAVALADLEQSPVHVHVDGRELVTVEPPPAPRGRDVADTETPQ